MRKISTLVLFLSILPSTTQAGGVLTTEAYMKIRGAMRSQKVTEYQAKRVCDKLDGIFVHMESWVVGVDRDGTVNADMDRELFSVADISLSLVNDDQTAGLHTGQFIEYTGTLSGCRYIPATGTLFLAVSGGRLLAHY
jgi:hypothetical protein